MAVLEQGDDFGNFDNWGIELDADRIRERAIVQVGFAAIRDRDFITHTPEGHGVPVDTQKWTLEPVRGSKPKQGIDRLDVANPYAIAPNTLGVPEEVDRRFTFLRAYHAGAKVWSMLLSSEGLMPYKTSNDIAIARQGGDTIFRVKQGGEGPFADIYHRHFGDYVYPTHGFEKRGGELDAAGLIWDVMEHYRPAKS